LPRIYCLACGNGSPPVTASTPDARGARDWGWRSSPGSSRHTPVTLLLPADRGTPASASRFRRRVVATRPPKSRVRSQATPSPRTSDSLSRPGHTDLVQRPAGPTKPGIATLNAALGCCNMASHPRAPWSCIHIPARPESTSTSEVASCDMQGPPEMCALVPSGPRGCLACVDNRCLAGDLGQYLNAKSDAESQRRRRRSYFKFIDRFPTRRGEPLALWSGQHISH
jgi:hypothetical protein